MTKPEIPIFDPFYPFIEGVIETSTALHIRMSDFISKINEMEELEYLTEPDKKKLTELKEQLQIDKVEMQKRIKNWDENERCKIEIEKLIERIK